MAGGARRPDGMPEIVFDVRPGKPELARQGRDRPRLRQDVDELPAKDHGRVCLLRGFCGPGGLGSPYRSCRSGDRRALDELAGLLAAQHGPLPVDLKPRLIPSICRHHTSCWKSPASGGSQTTHAGRVDSRPEHPVRYHRSGYRRSGHRGIGIRFRWAPRRRKAASISA